MAEMMVRMGLVGLVAVAVGCGTAADPAADAAGYVAPGLDESNGGATVECLTDTECVAALAPGSCETAMCNAGTCVKGNKPERFACSSDGLTLGECQTGRCDGAGSCVAGAASDGQPCGVSDACQAQLCGGGVCKTAELKSCDDGNACTDDTCDPSVGCVSTNNSAECDDGNACTEGDACADGVCTSGPYTCECFEASDCDETGLDKCTTEYACEANKCVEVPNVVLCTDTGGLGQCEIRACNPSTGQCETQTNENAACDDANACTTGEFCAQNGNCIGGTPTVCSQEGLTQCEISVCDPGTGTCGTESNTGADCSDNNPCTDGDTCAAGSVCLPGTTLVCEISCIDTIDEDNDGDTDCEDEDCSASAVCLGL